MNKKKYLMLIDDDPDEMEFFLDALEKLPGLFEFGYAVNPKVAMSLLTDVTPDYFLIDMNMPAINGLECVSMIRKEQAVQHVPAFIYTTGYNAELQRQAVAAGADGCIRKPSQPDMLVEMLRNLFHHGHPEVKR